jgi:hypothetical protein
MKSETSGIEIPDSITADDGTIYTMSPIESPLSLARKRYTAQMINEQIAMIKAGMSAEEVIAYYENKEKGMKKKEKGCKRDLMQPTILEIPDLDSTGPLEPPPPIQKKPSMQPTHFKAIKDHTEQPQLMKRRSAAPINLDKLPKPDHCLAFEGANQHNNHRSGSRGEVIRTKSLQVMQRAGGPTPPHFMAMEMENQKKKKSSSSNTRKPSPKRLERTMSLNRSRSTADKSENHPDITEKNGRHRGKGADLSAELNAFFAKQKKLSLVKGRQSVNKAPNVSLSSANSYLESNIADPQRTYDVDDSNDTKYARMRRHDGVTLETSKRMERSYDRERRDMIPKEINHHSDDSVDFLNDTTSKSMVERRSSFKKKPERNERHESKSSGTGERRGSYKKMERLVIADDEYLSMLDKEESRTSGERRGSYKKPEKHSFDDETSSSLGKVDNRNNDMMHTSLRAAIERHFSEDGVDLYRQIKKGFPGDKSRKSTSESATSMNMTSTTMITMSQESETGGIERKVGRRGSGIKLTSNTRVGSHSPPAPPSRSKIMSSCHRSYSPGPRRRSRSPRPTSSIHRNSNVIPLTEHPLFK